MTHIKKTLTALLLCLSPLVNAVPGDNQLIRSAVTVLSAGDATITLAVPRDHSHNFAGVAYYNSSTGSTINLVTPTTGSETYTLETAVKPGVFQTFTNNTATSSTPGQVDWASNTTRVRVVLSGVTGNGVTHAQLIFFGNEQ